MRHFLAISMLCLTALADEWPNPPYIPTPPVGFGTNWHRSNYTNSQFTFNYGSGAAAYRVDSLGRPYTHYVAPNHPSATDTDNAFGTEDTPRLTRPNPPFADGTVLYQSGGLLSNIGGITRSGGTNPIYICGDPTNMPLHLVGEQIKCDNVVLEYIDWFAASNASKTISVGRFYNAAISNFVIRNCTFRGGATNPAASYQHIRLENHWTNDNRTAKFCIYSNDFGNIGQGRTDISGEDAIGISFDLGVEDGWVMWNTSGVSGPVGGELIQVAADSYTGNTNFGLPKRLYVFENIAGEHAENFIDLKGCQDVVVTRNFCYGFDAQFGAITLGSSSVPFRYGQQDIAVPGMLRSNIWTMGNVVSNSAGTDGAFIYYHNASYEGAGKDIYFLFNQVINASNDTHTAVAFGHWDVESIHWLNNTATDVDKGFVFFTVTNENAVTEIKNNVVTHRNDSTNQWLVVAVGTSNALWTADIGNNVFWSTNVEPYFRVGYKNPTTSYTNYTWETLLDSGWSHWLTASTNSNPLLTSYVPAAGSPCVNAGADISDVLNLYSNRFGVRADYDLAGRRLRTTYSIGAYERWNDRTITNLYVGSLLVGE